MKRVKRLSECGSGFLQLKKVVDGKTVRLFTRMRCKRWDCDVCRLKKAKCVQRVIYKLMDKPKLQFLTITDMHKTSVEQAWATFGRRWNHLRTLLTQKYGQFSFVRVLEPHKAPCYPHMHVLVDIEIHPVILRNYCRQAGFGWICDIQDVTTEGAVGYISKYLTKDWMANGADAMRRKTKARIVQCSRDLGAIFATVSDWEFIEKYSNNTACESAIRKTLSDLDARTTGAYELEVNERGYSVYAMTDQIDTPLQSFQNSVAETSHDRRKRSIRLQKAKDTARYVCRSDLWMQGALQSPITVPRDLDLNVPMSVVADPECDIGYVQRTHFFSEAESPDLPMEIQEALMLF